MNEVEDFLEHFGKKGMRWGVRTVANHQPSSSPVLVKTSGSRPIKTAGGRGHSPSSDAKEHAARLRLARKSGLQSLSDKDLKALNSRIQMETNFRKTVPRTRTQKAVKFVGNFIAKQGQRELAALKPGGSPGPIAAWLSGKNPKVNTAVTNATKAKP